MGRGAAVLPHNYPHLQNLIKRDAGSYHEEFLQQYQHFKASLAIVQMRPAASDDHFESLVTFLSHVSSYYAESKTEFAKIVMSLLETEALNMNSSLRRCLVQCLLLLRKTKVVDLTAVLMLLFKLFRIQDKSLRELLFYSIVGEIRRANKPHRNNALNKSLQNMMYATLNERQAGIDPKLGQDENIAMLKSLQIIIELYRRKIWDDAHSVNIIAEAAMKNVSGKILVIALEFFVGRFQGKALDDDSLDSDGDSDNEASPDYQNMLHRSHINGTKRSDKKKLKRVLNAVHRKEKKDHESNRSCGFAAIDLLNDPQSFIERLFSHLKQSKENFEVKLLLMNVISRVIGAQKLILLDFYSLLLRYIQPHQKSVTQVLAYAAQASHDLLPPDIINPLLKAIANNFVAEHCANEVIAAGLNGLREICSRCPLAMDADLLQDLSRFKGYQDKGVIMAARSLIGLYRELNPELLHRRDRGKEVSIAMKNGTGSKKVSFADSRSNVHLDASGVFIMGNADEPTADDNEDDWEEIVDNDFEGGSLDEWEEASFPEEGSESESIQSTDETAPVSDKSRNGDIIALAASQILSVEDVARLKRRIHGQPEPTDTDEEAEDQDDSDDNQPRNVVNPSSLESSKKTKADYAARLASVEAGREDRLKHGSRKGKHNENSSVSNRLKARRTKNAIMLAHKPEVRAKKRRSLKEKQLAQNAHRKRQKTHR